MHKVEAAALKSINGPSLKRPRKECLPLTVNTVSLWRNNPFIDNVQKHDRERHHINYAEADSLVQGRHITIIYYFALVMTQFDLCMDI
jgi:hypothetical protein